MFKKNRHVYTCPDVIYMRNRYKKSAYTQIGVSLVLVLAPYAYGRYLEHKEDRELKNSNPEN